MMEIMRKSPNIIEKKRKNSYKTNMLMVLQVMIENNLKEHHAGFDFLDFGETICPFMLFYRSFLKEMNRVV